MTDAAATAPSVKAGDKVQVKYIDGGSPATREACDRTGRKFEPVHWLFADVLEALPDGSLRVNVNHRANPLHGKQTIIAAGEFRTADDVAEALRVAQNEAQFRPSAESKRRAKSLQVQLDRLTAPAKKASAKQPSGK